MFPNRNHCMKGGRQLKLLMKLITGNSGQGLTEYGLVLGLLVAAAAAGLLLAGQRAVQLYTDSNTAIDSVI